MKTRSLKSFNKNIKDYKILILPDDYNDSSYKNLKTVKSLSVEEIKEQLEKYKK